MHNALREAGIAPRSAPRASPLALFATDATPSNAQLLSHAAAVEPEPTVRFRAAPIGSARSVSLGTEGSRLKSFLDDLRSGRETFFTDLEAQIVARSVFVRRAQPLRHLTCLC
jgi:hypothetical protein